VLVARNIHHSVINAIKAFGLDFRFLPTPYEPRFEAVLPPSADGVLDALARYPEALAVLYTTPTYEGLAANTRAIVRAVHAASDHAMVIVDEAWGGHLRFHPDLPESAMGAGADICVQSTHKLAGGLQQTGLIHWHTAASTPSSRRRSTPACPTSTAWTTPRGSPATATASAGATWSRPRSASAATTSAATTWPGRWSSAASSSRRPACTPSR
jgi:arginine/lysine/ornithine decarboxylase